MAYSSSLSAGELTALRAGDHTVKRYLSPIPLSSVGTARINQSSFDVPLAQLTIDNLSVSFTSLVKGGMTAWIGTTAGARDIGVYRVRKTPTANTLYIQELSNGDPGLLASRDLQPLADNAYITIYEGENVWSVASRIEYSGGVDARVGTFYKDYDTAYTDQNETGGDVPCILNIGNHRTGFVDTTTGLLTTSWTADTYIWDGATVSTYLWNVDGGAITVGSTSTQSITVTHTYGNYLIECTITLSTGAVIVARRWVIASEPTNNPPIEIQVSSDRRDQYGRRMSIRTLESVSTITQGQLAIYWESATWGGTTVSSATTQFVGFVKSYSGQAEPNVTSQTLELVSALELLKSTAAFGQQLVVTSNPATWTELSASLSHIDFFFMHLMYWHTTILRLFDYEPVLLQSYTTQAWKVDGGNLYQQLQNAGTRLNVTVGQASNGTIFARRDPNLMSQTARDLKITRMTMTESDVKSITPSYSVRNQVGKVSGTGFYYDSGSLTPLAAVFPGNVGGQGSEVARLEGQLVTLSGGQAELGERLANEFARLNNPFPDMNIFIPYNLDVFEPAEKYWTALLVGASYWHNSDGLNLRGLVTAVTINHLENGKKTTTLSFVAETAGVDTDAETVPVQLPSGGNAPYLEGNSYTLAPLTPYNLTSGLLTFQPPLLETPDYTVAPPLLTETESGTGTLVAFQAGTLKLSTNISAGTPTFTTIHNPAGGKIGASLVPDATTGLYVAYDDASNSYIYLISNVAGTPSASLKQTFNNRMAGILRKPAGVTNGVAFYSPNDQGTWSHTIDFTATDGGFSPIGGRANYIGGTGWSWADGGALRRVDIGLTGLRSHTITSMSMTFDYNGVAIHSRDWYMAVYKTPSGEVQTYSQINPPTPVTNETVTATGLSETNVQGYRFEIQIDDVSGGGSLSGDGLIKSVTLEGTGESPFGDVKVYYSSNNGTTMPAVTVASYQEDSGYDLDDFNLGIHLAAANFNVYYTSTYTGAFTAFSGLDGVNGTDNITCIRIPYRKLLTQALNNDSTSLQFIYSTSAGYTGAAVFNAATGTIASESDMSIVIAATTYYVIGDLALESYGSNTQIINALVQAVGGGDTKLVRTEDGGTTWEIMTTYDGTAVHIQEPTRDGNGERIYFNGADGLKYSAGGGSSALTKSATATTQVWYLSS